MELLINRTNFIGPLRFHLDKGHCTSISHIKIIVSIPQTIKCRIAFIMLLLLCFKLSIHSKGSSLLWKKSSQSPLEHLYTKVSLSFLKYIVSRFLICQLLRHLSTVVASLNPLLTARLWHQLPLRQRSQRRLKISFSVVAAVAPRAWCLSRSH